MISFGIEWEVTDRDGLTLGTLAGTSGVITWSGWSTTQRTVRGVQFRRDEWRHVNPLTDCVRPMFVDRNGTSTPLGLFVVASDPERYRRPDDPEPAEPFLTDLGWLLDQTAPFTLAGRPGESLTAFIGQVCDAALVARRRIDVVDEVIGEPIAFPAGGTYGQALASLAELAGFLPPHFDRDGVLVLRLPPQDDDEAAIVYESGSIVVDTRTEESNLLTSPNTFLVIGSGATAGPVTAVAEVDASLPNSVQNRNGVRVVKVVNEQGIDSVFQADRVAARLAATASAQYRTIRFGTAPNPAHDAFSVVRVRDVSCLEWGWTMGLTPGDVMTHEVYSTFEVTNELR